MKYGSFANYTWYTETLIEANASLKHELAGRQTMAQAIPVMH